MAYKLLAHQLDVPSRLAGPRRAPAQFKKTARRFHGGRKTRANLIRLGSAMTLQKCLISLGASLACSTVFAGTITILSEDFDDVDTLAGKGWVQKNNSSPPGATNWFQGNPGVFPAAAGAANSYIAANFLNAATGGAVSNWLITPELSLANGEMLDFALRLKGDGFVDTVGVYLSVAGASIDVGATPTSLGDFGLLQLFSSDSDTGWTMQSLALSGLAAPTTGRLAFRYLVGDTNLAGDYVGIDSVRVRAVPEPGSLALAVLGFGALAWRRRQARAADAAAIL